MKIFYFQFCIVILCTIFIYYLAYWSSSSSSSINILRRLTLQSSQSLHSFQIFMSFIHYFLVPFIATHFTRCNQLDLSTGMEDVHPSKCFCQVKLKSVKFLLEDFILLLFFVNFRISPGQRLPVPASPRGLQFESWPRKNPSTMGENRESAAGAENRTGRFSIAASGPVRRWRSGRVPIRGS